MKNVFLFPGQGAQKKGMFLDICKKYPEAMKTVLRAEEISGEPVGQFMWETEDVELARSDKSQLAITTASLALVKVLESKNITADVCAGFSLGEFSALCTAGVLTFEDTIRIVAERGKIMQKTCEVLAASSDGEQPGMAAVIGLTPEVVEKTVEPLTQKGICFAANMNSPKQTVVSGTAEGLLQAEELCKSAGCRRFIRLKVAGPFHSPLMAAAAKEFESVLNSVDFLDPTKRLFSNVTGKEITLGSEAKKLAVLHFTNPVRWTSEEAEIAEIIKADEEGLAEAEKPAESGKSGEIAEAGKSKESVESAEIRNWNIFEVGPGNVLSGLWRDSGFAEKISCKSINNLENLEM